MFGTDVVDVKCPPGHTFSCAYGISAIFGFLRSVSLFLYLNIYKCMYVPTCNYLMYLGIK